MLRLVRKSVRRSRAVGLAEGDDRPLFRAVEYAKIFAVESENVVPRGSSTGTGTSAIFTFTRMEAARLERWAWVRLIVDRRGAVRLSSAATLGTRRQNREQRDTSMVRIFLDPVYLLRTPGRGVSDLRSGCGAYFCLIHATYLCARAMPQAASECRDSYDRRLALLRESRV